MGMPDINQPAHEFWEELYKNASADTKGRPSAMLERYVAKRTPGVALDLGCAKGDDAVWLAKRGWHVTAVDISPTALDHARANAERNGVADCIDFQVHDLSKSFPDLACDLVTAMFLHTPLEFPRAQVLQRAAKALRPGGLLLIVGHGSVAPWQWEVRSKPLPAAKDSLAELDLPASDWVKLFVGIVDREGTGPEGQKASVSDTIIALERL